MSQPFTIYDTETGEALRCASPRWADEQVKAGRYSYEPVQVTCVATTKAGESCRLPAQPGSDRCHIHGKRDGNRN